LDAARSNVIENNPEALSVAHHGCGFETLSRVERRRAAGAQVLSLASEQDAEKFASIKAESLAEIEVVYGQAGTVRSGDAS